MVETGTFVTTWQDSLGERWDGYFEPVKVCWQEGPQKQEAASLKSAQNIKIENVDVNGDGYPDRFELVGANDAYQIKLFRGVKTQNSSGCGGRYFVSDGIGFEKEGLLIKTISKAKVTQLEWQKAKPEEKIFGRLVVSGVEVFGSASKKVRWEFLLERCPPPPETQPFREWFGGGGCP